MLYLLGFFLNSQYWKISRSCPSPPSNIFERSVHIIFVGQMNFSGASRNPWKRYGKLHRPRPLFHFGPDAKQSWQRQRWLFKLFRVCREYRRQSPNTLKTIPPCRWSSQYYCKFLYRTIKIRRNTIHSISLHWVFVLAVDHVNKIIYLLWMLIVSLLSATCFSYKNIR